MGRAQNFKAQNFEAQNFEAQNLMARGLMTASGTSSERNVVVQVEVLLGAAPSLGRTTGAEAAASAAAA